ncbi:MAG TPA: hypothetical protein DDW52_08280 [Planctomycetaceae bacterium]|nr:hypothetical protein [Planctomycetaceae bacterium]
MEELIAGSVLGDLSAEEQAELDSVNLEPFQDLLFDLRKTAAAVDLACMPKGSVDPMPTAVRQRIEADAGQYVAKPELRRTTAAHASTSSRMGVREAIAWITCAVCLFLCIGLLRKVQSDPVVAQADGSKASVESTDAATTLSDEREQLLGDESSIQVAWADGTTPIDGGVSGDVVWNTSRQSGVMRFVGLPVNDPTVEQYQLWIIDPDRDDEPIDGGVFNVTSEQEALVAIDAKLKVLNPKAFAITIEQPGGVVVSTQDRLPLLAAVEG